MKASYIPLVASLALASASFGTRQSSTFAYYGANEGGPGFGENHLPGTWGTDFIFPDNNAIDTLLNDGFNTFRIAFAMERLVPNQLTGAADAGYLRNLTATVDYITGKGAYAVVDPHNFGRYYGSVITDASAFRAFWETVATNFRGNSRVIFDTNNEYHDMDQQLVFDLNQAAIAGIRAVGATSQEIWVEGNFYSGASSWNVTNDNLKGLTDPSNKIVYEMHQYLDSDGSGTHDTCVSNEIGAQRVSGATEWLKINGKKGVLGEFAGGPNDQCKAAVRELLNHLGQNNDVWAGALWWAAGPWWGDYMFSLEPPSAIGYTNYLSILQEANKGG